MSARQRCLALLVMAAVSGGCGSVVARATGAAAAPASGTTTKSGVYTADQASRGFKTYIRNCSACHGDMFNGSESGPPLDGTLIDRWKGKTLADIFAKMRTSMPPSPAAKLPDHDYVDVIAQVLSISGEPAGKAELPADAKALEAIRVE